MSAMLSWISHLTDAHQHHCSALQPVIPRTRKAEMQKGKLFTTRIAQSRPHICSSWRPVYDIALRE